MAASSGDDTFASEFMALVDAYIAQHPVLTTTLSRASLRFAAGKILILQSGRGKELNWPGEGATRLAAILLVLFLHDGLRKSRDTILGITSQELYTLLCRIVSERQLSREDVMDALLEVDTEGTALQLVQHREFKALWHASVREGSEHGSSDKSRTGAAGQSRSRRRARRFLSLFITWVVENRYILSPLFAISITVGDLRGAWMHSERWKLIVLGRGAINGALVATTLMMFITVFPDELDTPGARRYITPICMVTDAAGATNMLISLARSGPMHTDAQSLCRSIHAIFVVVACINYANDVYVRIWCSHSSWRWMRKFMAIDGVIYMSFVALMRATGPPASYPPGAVPFGAAFGRGFMTMAVSALSTPANRRRLSALAGGVRPMSSTSHRGAKPSSKLEVFSKLREIFDADEDLVVESARIEELDATADIQRAVRQRLASRAALFRMGTVILALLWFFIADYLHIWKSHSLIFGRPVFFNSSLMVGLWIITSSFPSDLSTASAHKFVLPCNILCAISGTASASMAFNRATAAPMSAQLLGIHRFIRLVVSGVWVVNAIFCLRRKYSWRAVRTTLLLDGSIYTVCMLTIRALGEQIYPHAIDPGNFENADREFAAALMRASGPLLLGLLLNESNRQRIASIATGAGWNHVILSLNQTTALGQHAPGEGSQLSESDADLPSRPSHSGKRSSSRSGQEYCSNSESGADDGGTMPAAAALAKSGSQVGGSVSTVTQRFPRRPSASASHN